MPNSIGNASASKPAKPTADFPLFPHANGRWAKKIKGKTVYFGRWANPDEALAKYRAYLSDGGSSRKQVTVTTKPERPYPEFPLFPHATKRWAKKIKGRLHYFGRWDDWQGSLENYQYQMPYLLRGQTPPPKDQAALTVGELVNLFLEDRERSVKTGEITSRTWKDYCRIGAVLIENLGRHTPIESTTRAEYSQLRAAIAKGKVLASVNSELARIKAILNHAHEAELIERPLSIGKALARPKKKALRKERQSKAAKEFSIEELQVLYHAASQQMKCFILLALNGGLGNNDIGLLESRHIKDGWITYPRPKTSVDRRFPLWKETIQAIEKTRQRKQPDNPLVFLTIRGSSWSKDSSNPISHEFQKLVKRLNLHQKSRGFYSLRHQFRTIADGCRDQVAVNHIMGHDDGSMANNYREHIDDQRLQAVTDFVYKWVKPMFRKPAKKAGKAGAE